MGQRRQQAPFPLLDQWVHHRYILHHEITRLKNVLFLHFLQTYLPGLQSNLAREPIFVEDSCVESTKDPLSLIKTCTCELTHFPLKHTVPG